MKQGPLQPVVIRWGLLILGQIAGLSASLAFSALDPGGTADLVAAQSEGIVSVSILSGYPKSRDFFSFVATFLFCSGFSLLALRISGWVAGEKGCPAPPFPEPETGGRSRSWKFCLAAVGCAYLLASFHAGGIRESGWNPLVGAWVFLGEEGENVAWAQSILAGDVYGKDFFCLYGPLMVYPLAAVLALFGKTVLVARYYRFFLDLAGYGIVLWFLYRTGRFRVAFIAFAAIHFLFNPPLLAPSPNFSYLRFAAPLAPFLLFLGYREDGRAWRLFLAGALTTALALMSIEVGTASLLALGGALLLDTLLRREPAAALREGALFAGGILAPLVPFLLYFHSRGALPGVYESLIGFPRYTMMGYGGIPAPSLQEFLGDPLGPGIMYYFMIFLYALSAAGVASAFLGGRRDRETWLRLLLLAYGLALFPVAVRRFAVGSEIKVFLPAFLLWTRFVEEGVARFLAAGRGGERRCCAAGLAAILLAFTVPSAASPLIRHYLSVMPALFQEGKFGYRGADLAGPPFARAGVKMDDGTAASVRAIASFLDRQPKGRDDVFFFPNEPMYYFLFDRVPPTRYVMSYMAASRKERLEIIGDLERKRTPFVVYSLRTWRIDDIPEEIQVPEIHAYILKNYTEVYRAGDVMILARNG